MLWLSHNKKLSVAGPNPCPDLHPCPDPSLCPDTCSFPVLCSVTAKCPCPPTIPVNLPVSAKASLTTCTLCVISAGGNKTAAFHSSAPHTLVTGSCPFKEVNYPSSCSIYFLSLFITHTCFNIPDPHDHCLVDPR